MHGVCADVHATDDPGVFIPSVAAVALPEADLRRGLPLLMKGVRKFTESP